MNALINLKECREHMLIILDSEKYEVKLGGTLDDPYFCGNFAKRYRLAHEFGQSPNKKTYVTYSDKKTQNTP